MPQLQRMDGSALPGSFTLVAGNVLLFKVSGFGRDKKHLVLSSSNANVFTVQVLKADRKNTEQQLRLVVGKVTKSTTARLKVATAGNEDQPGLAVEVTVEPLLTLPAKGTESGAVCRVLLAENITPDGNKFQSIAEAKSSMQWMRSVLENRRDSDKPSRFKIKATRPTLLDVIKAPLTIEGFEDYPEVADEQHKLLVQIMESANDGTGGKFELYRQFVRAAIAVADESDVGNPPTGLLGWRTTGRGSPGDGFERYGDKVGNTFFVLRPPAPKKAEPKNAPV
ncbi:MAG: hypothetical protein RL701_6608, partial [Pseudomonadota bacterium]